MARPPGELDESPDRKRQTSRTSTGRVASVAMARGAGSRCAGAARRAPRNECGRADAWANGAVLAARENHNARDEECAPFADDGRPPAWPRLARKHSRPSAYRESSERRRRRRQRPRRRVSPGNKSSSENKRDNDGNIKLRQQRRPQRRLPGWSNSDRDLEGRRRANDNQMLLAARTAAATTTTTTSGSVRLATTTDCERESQASSGRTRKGQARGLPCRTDGQLVVGASGPLSTSCGGGGEQRARNRGLEFIRSSRRARNGLFARLLVVMQIITILPCCLIIYHGPAAADCAPNVGGPSALPHVQFASAAAATDGGSSDRPPEVRQKIHVKVGILLEESNHEQANMFIRTIKMINDQRDETIRQLLNMLAASKRATGVARPGGASGGGRRSARRANDQMQTTPRQQLALFGETNPLQQRQDEGLAPDGAKLQPEKGEEAAAEAGGGGVGEPAAIGKTAEEIQPAVGGGSTGDQQIKSTRPAGHNDKRQRRNADEAAAARSERPDRLPKRNEATDRHEDELARRPGAEMAATRANLETGRRAAAGLNESSFSAVGPTAAQLLKHESHRASGGGSYNSHAYDDGQLSGTVNGRAAKSIKSRAALVASGEPDNSERARQLSFDIELEPMIEFLEDRQSALEADEKVCQLIESGVFAIFGPTDGRSIQHIQSVCDNLEIPYFELRPFIGSGSGSGMGTGLGTATTTTAGFSSSPPLPVVDSAPSAGDSGGGGGNGYVPSVSSSSASSVPATTSSASRSDESAASGEPPARRYLQQQHQQSPALVPVLDERGERGHEYETSDSQYPNSVSGAGLVPKIITTRDAGADESGSAGASVTRGVGDIEADQYQQQQQRRQRRQHRTSSSSQPSTGANKLEALTLNLYPPSHLLNSAYIDLIYALNWTSFAIVYEDSASMIKLQNIFKESSPFNGWSNKWRIRLFRHDPNGIYGEYSVASEAPNRRPANSVNQARPIGGQRADGDDQVTVMNGASGRLAQEAQPGTSAVLAATAPRLHRANSSSSWSFLQDEREQDERDHHLRLSRETASGITGDHYSEPVSATTKHSFDDNPVLLKRDTSGAARSWSPGGPPGGTYRDVFWRVKMSGEHNVLLDIKTENLYEALKQAQQVGCMTEEYSYLITSLDLHTIDLEDFKYSRTKITGLSLAQVTRAAATSSSFRESPSTGGQASEAAAAAAAAATTTTMPSPPTSPAFDERYLENLGVYSLQQVGESTSGRPVGARERQHQQRNAASKLKGQQKQQQQQAPPSGGQTRERAPASLSSWSSFDWINEAESNDESRREMLQSSPASLSLLPTVDRNNEQRLFDFFLEQQERNVSRVRLSTSSAIIHDSLILYMLGLAEMDPSGQFLLDGARQSQPIYCSLDSQPWLHGSSLVNYMKQMTFNGLTGFVSFDQRGLRTDFKLDVLGMAPNIRLVKIGEWHSRYASEETRGNGNTNAKGGNTAAPDYIGSRASTVAGVKMASRSTITATATTSGAQQRLPSTMAPSSEMDSLEEAQSYDELSSKYENQLRAYNQMLARGEPVHVPYRKRVSPNGALLVNDIIFERLYRERADKIDTLIVTAKLSQPYFMLRETPNKLVGNDQFEGYAVDLIHELSKLVNFRYKWREVADKKYGSKEKLANGTIVWNGMIGEIVRGTADLAIVDLTITAQREEAVDFTLPFMNTGISILFKKPTTKVTTLFSFLSPFSSDVWAYVLAAYCGISAILFLVGHLSPYEWADPHPCRHLNPDSDLTVLENQFSLLNSFWFTIGSLMQQGSDLTPRSMSTRTIAGIWYFFTLIMISSYTANLAAFLTVEKVVYPIENVRDLSNQQEIKYGCVESGSTCLFFHDSQIDTYKKIDGTMFQYRTYVRSNDEGQKRVGEGKFAFFMESTTIEYIIERNCNLTQIGGLLDSKGYGIALAKKSRHKRPYRTLLNEGILHLQETGMLHVLKNRWWKEKRGGGTCTDDGKGGGVTELSLANVGGVFVVLLGGLGISFLVAIAEFIWKARRGGSSRDRMCEEMMNDLKFALACESSTKPIQKVAGMNNGANHNNNNNNNSSGSGRHRNPNQADSSSNPSRQRLADGRRAVHETTGNPNGFTGYHYQAPETITAASNRLLLADGIRGGNKFLPATFDGSEASLRAAAADKRCNPILLHAMLTMLSADQPTGGARQQGQRLVVGAASAPLIASRQQQAAYLGAPRPYDSHDSPMNGAHLLANDTGSDYALDGNDGQDDNNNDDDNDDDDDDEIGDVLIDGEQDEEDNFNMCDDDDEDDEMIEQLKTAATLASGRYRVTTNKQQRAGELADMARRRMLHGQKTIDID